MSCPEQFPAAMRGRWAAPYVLTPTSAVLLLLMLPLSSSWSPVYARRPPLIVRGSIPILAEKAYKNWGTGDDIPARCVRLAARSAGFSCLRGRGALTPKGGMQHESGRWPCFVLSRLHFGTFFRSAWSRRSCQHRTCLAECVTWTQAKRHTKPRYHSRLYSRLASSSL